MKSIHFLYFKIFVSMLLLKWSWIETSEEFEMETRGAETWDSLLILSRISGWASYNPSQQILRKRPVQLDGRLHTWGAHIRNNHSFTLTGQVRVLNSPKIHVLGEHGNSTQEGQRRVLTQSRMCQLCCLFITYNYFSWWRFISLSLFPNASVICD